MREPLAVFSKARCGAEVDPLFTIQSGPYGGGTWLIPTVYGSPARNAVLPTNVVPGLISDQRGFPIIGAPDIGAYEAGTYPTYEIFIVEYLPATATTVQRTASFDYDGDGQSNGLEYTNLTNPLIPNVAPPTAAFQATIVRSAGNFIITFPSTSGKTYSLWTSTTLAPLNSWLDTGMPTIAGDGSTKTFTFSVPADPKRFYRVQSN